MTTNPPKGRSPDDRPGEELQETIRGLVGDDQDAEVQEALAQAYHAIQDDQRPSTGLVIDQAAQLVDLGVGNISPREAILRMAGAGFDYQVAVTTYLDESVEGDSPLLSSPSGKDRERESAKVEGPEEGDAHVSDHDMEEESESSLAVCTNKVAVLQIRFVTNHPYPNRRNHRRPPSSAGTGWRTAESIGPWPRRARRTRPSSRLPFAGWTGGSTRSTATANRSISASQSGI